MAYCYRLYDASDRLLYVGVSENATMRWKDHSRDKAWWPEVVRKVAGPRKLRVDALIEEAYAIDNENPVYNRREGRSHLGWVTLPEPGAEPNGYINASRTEFSKHLARAQDGTHMVAMIDRDPAAVLLPYDWYRRACVAMGLCDPGGDDQSELIA